MNLMWWKRARDARGERSDAATARDERLSAYLDGDISADARVRLEIELATDTDLRDALEGIREVRALLGSFPEVRAPRSFALPAPVVRAPSRLEWATRLGTVAAAVAFVIALGNSGVVGTRGEETATMSRASDSAGAAAGASTGAPDQKATATGATMEAARVAVTPQGELASGATPALAPAAPVAPPPTGGFTAPSASTPQPPTTDLARVEAAGEPQRTPAPLDDSAHDGQGLDREGRAATWAAAALAVLVSALGLAALGQWIARRRGAQRGA
jgi:hypothetical protein